MSESLAVDRDEERRRAPDILSQIKDSYEGLRPSERSVADAVLADVRGAVEASNAALAHQAGVSEPTVTRFCRAIGCEGVRDFKLKLAQSLVVGDLYLDPTAPAEAASDDLPSFWGPVLGEARRALREVERQLEPGPVLQAAEAIAGAGNVAAFGLGGSASALAQEVQHRLFRYGVQIAATADPYLMRMTASTLGPGDVVIALSTTGKTQEIVDAVEMARHYRATAIAITAPGTELARAANVALTVEVPEYPDALKPTAVRFAFLAIIDLMSAATGYRMGGAARERLRRIKYNVLARRSGRVLEPLGD